MNLLYSHYGITSSSKIRLKNIMPLLIKAIEREQESRIWDRWIKLCPYMELKQINFISFDDYRKALMEPKPKTSVKTSEEIMAEMMPVIKAHEAKGNV